MSDPKVSSIHTEAERAFDANQKKVAKYDALVKRQTNYRRQLRQLQKSQQMYKALFEKELFKRLRDRESADIRIANLYKEVTSLRAALPFWSRWF